MRPRWRRQWQLDCVVIQRSREHLQACVTVAVACVECACACHVRVREFLDTHRFIEDELVSHRQRHSPRNCRPVVAAPATVRGCAARSDARLHLHDTIGIAVGTAGHGRRGVSAARICGDLHRKGRAQQVHPVACTLVRAGAADERCPWHAPWLRRSIHATGAVVLRVGAVHTVDQQLGVAGARDGREPQLPPHRPLRSTAA